MRCLPRSNGNLTTGPVSHWVTGHRWNTANNYLTLTFEVCCTSKLNSPILSIMKAKYLRCIIIGVCVLLFASCADEKTNLERWSVRGLEKAMNNPLFKDVTITSFLSRTSTPHKYEGIGIFPLWFY